MSQNTTGSTGDRIAAGHRQLEDLYTLAHPPGHEISYRGHRIAKEPHDRTRTGCYRIINPDGQYLETVELDAFDSSREWLWFVDTVIEDSPKAAREFVLED